MKHTITLLAALLLTAVVGSLASVARADEPASLKDKTLVAWVAPANLEQRGGSVLSIDDQQGHFDGIVFGEKSSGKWMAGSERFLRTQSDQSAFPLEMVDAKTLVQIAMVYQGKQITCYRNGVQYSRHEIPGDPISFGPQSAVLIGKRHLTQGGKERFAGSIDDARIYDLALRADQLKALKPKVASEIKPWAWWTFDGPEAKDCTGRFVTTELAGGAKVAEGKLALDGVAGEMLAKAKPAVPVFETPNWPTNPPASWATFHLADPGPVRGINDPNCAFFWKGRYHLHYIYWDKSGCAFRHVSSTDMVHWKWHPTTLTQQAAGHGMFSGTGFFTKAGKPAIIYHGQGSGRNQISIAEDDQLEQWSKPMKVEPNIRPDQDGSKISNWDPDAWLDGDTYYALSGGRPGSGQPATLFKSADLKAWDYVGLFLANDMPDVGPKEDISCPNFFKLGNKHMLLCISHNRGCRYYLGTWQNEKFTPDFHARMSWNQKNFFAPESLLTPDGRRVMWAWVWNLAAPGSLQSLPRELSLPEDGVLRIKPLRELETLRYDEMSLKNIEVINNISSHLKEITGDALELKLSIDPGTAKKFGLEVNCNAEGKSGLPITIDTEMKVLQVGGETAPFELKAGERAELRVFIDKNLVEVFVNDRQAVVSGQGFNPQNTGIQLFSQGGNVVVPELKSWKMKSIYSNGTDAGAVAAAGELIARAKPETQPQAIIQPVPEKTDAEPSIRIAWVGDSITQGYGLANADKVSPPGVLRNLLVGRASVKNFGMSGTTLLKKGDNSYWLREPFKQAKKCQPNVVIIMLGANDSKPQNWVHSDEIAADMAALVSEFKTLPSHPEIFVVMPVPVYNPAFGITEEILKKVRPLLAQGARQAGAKVVDFNRELSGQSKLFFDGVHPNEKGAALIGQLVAKNISLPK